MRILPQEAQGRELRVQTHNLSYQGLYFRSEAQFEVGKEIEFVITLPRDVSPSGTDVEIRCRGKIVRVEPAANGTTGIAAKIDRYEFLPAASAA